MTTQRVGPPAGPVGRPTKLMIREVQVKRALTKTGGFLRGYAYSLNPYGGCQFGAVVPGGDEEAMGCPFCYVRELPVARFRGEPWGGWVDAKVNLPDRLRQELATLDRRSHLAASRVFCASATDPYQPVAEGRYRITRRALEALIHHPPGGLLIQTRSLLVRRDLDLLRCLSRRTNLVVSVSIETDREDVRRALTPTSPPIAARRRLLGDLRAAGFFVQAAVSPLLPCDPAAFAEQLDPVVDRVILDTFQLGDGSGGRRSDHLGMAGRLERHGWGGWYRPDAYRPVLAAFRRVLGADRVLVSAEGFNTFPGKPADAEEGPSVRAARG
ncbi:MAG TPA: radical SAM protein [Dehalococcoidia bacterium]|nr:radical SAM protein [Dehalococcoidia bacterium]